MHGQTGLATLLSRPAKGLARPLPHSVSRDVRWVAPSGSGQGSCKTDDVAASILRQLVAWEMSLWLPLSIQPWQGGQGLAFREIAPVGREQRLRAKVGGGPAPSTLWLPG